jgi:hypothetical protein
MSGESMSEGESGKAANYSVFGLGDYSKPATVLIERVSDLIGGVLKPFQITRVAKAEAAAAIIQTESKIQVTELQQRAMVRLLQEEGRAQANMESITLQSLPLLEEKARPEDIETDWLTNFYEKCRSISDEEMQQIWVRVLSGEGNSPGAFSRRTVNLIEDLDKSDAELFRNLCSFGLMMGEVTPLVFDTQEKIYNDQGIDFSSLNHLESIGLIQFNSLSGYRRIGFAKQFVIFYFGQPIVLTMPKDDGNELQIGNVLLTQAGQQLATVCNAQPIPGFLEFVTSHWTAKGIGIETPRAENNPDPQAAE